MTIFGKCLYITFFVTMFLFTTVWDFIKNGDLALLENFFFSFWVASFLFMALLLRSKKDEAEKS
ncbi:MULTISPECIES: RNA polymerase subunit sigma [unclassified Lysinibacillus]|uniref:RNA polymerase subunit sigma n=1 Tax=unclassified Lysinibacillus TaxID=2636778 RepID=UPI00201124C9|nr:MULTISPECIES: RNA polymerase subunit sigma [unclassified Lysinibacillus]MCL1697047.1 RNA polymerase subunit sigma [Lysinibacillus sp. BPa_S21]MCL1701767.1 RNA polymerase subunit sigma [Lysinibacillus sp. Bpr_S20]